MEKYYLYIDECGDQNLEKYSDKFAIFTLCGIIVSQRQKENLRQKVLSLKRQVFGREDIIFHSFDMRRWQNGYEAFNDPLIRQAFYEGIDAILTETDAYIIVSCSTLKDLYVRQFGRVGTLYGQSLSAVIERSIFYLDDRHADGDTSLEAILEMRGKREDNALRTYFADVISKGTFWISPERMARHIHTLKFRPKSDNVIGLQIADIVAYPIAMHILHPERENIVYDLIRGHIYCNEGRLLGEKVVPKPLPSEAK